MTEWEEFNTLDSSRLTFLFNGVTLIAFGAGQP